MTLIDYLASLNTSDSQWTLWVNKTDIDDYEIVHESTQLDETKYLATKSLDKISFGYQSEYDALKETLENGVYYNGKVIYYTNDDVEKILYEYFDCSLDFDFQSFLEKEVEDLCKQWAYDEASYFIEKLELELEQESQQEQELVQI
jgi:hypothetical protein